MNRTPDTIKYCPRCGWTHHRKFMNGAGKVHWTCTQCGKKNERESR